MAIAGYLATIKQGSTTIADIQGFEMPFKTDMEDTTMLNSSSPGAKTFIPTLRGATYKLNGNWNKGDTGQAALETAYFARTLVSIVFSPDGVKTYSCSCWVPDYTIKAGVKGAVSADFSLQMNGDVTIV